MTNHATTPSNNDDSAQYITFTGHVSLAVFFEPRLRTAAVHLRTFWESQELVRLNVISL
jgi:hypothetical protein